MSDLDDQAAQVRGKGTDVGAITRTDSASREKRLIDQILVAAIIALVGSVWVLSRSVAVLQASDDYQNRRIDELRSDVKTLEGKTFRGVEGYGEPDDARNK